MVTLCSTTLLPIRLVLHTGWVLLYLIFSNIPVNGQLLADEKGWTDQPLLKHYTIEDGLPTHWVKGAVEDQHGYIWFATAGGLTRFDAHTFRLYPCQLEDDLDIGADRVLDLVIDQEGEIWISRLYRPLERFDPKTERSVSYASDNTDLPVDQIYDLFFDPPHYIWIGHSVGGLITRIDKRSDEMASFQVDANILNEANNKIWDLFRDQDGDLWAATNQGLYQFDSLTAGFKPYKFIYQGDGTNPAYFDNIQDFVSGKIIMETNLGPTLLDKKSRRISQLIELPKSYRSGVNGYFIRDGDYLWIANPAENNSHKGGIIRYNLTTNEVDFYPLESDIPLLRDQSGNIWLHNGKQGVSSFKSGQRKFISHHYPFSDKITAMIPHQSGIFWAGTERGLYKLAYNTENQPVVVEDLTAQIGAPISSLFQDRDGSLWVATTDELLRYLPDKSVKKYLDQRELNITNIFQDKDGTIWASGTSLVKIIPETGAYAFYSNSKIAELGSTQEDPYGNLWFTNKKRVMIFNKDQSQFFDLEVPYSHLVLSIYLDAKYAWIGSNTGLYGHAIGGL